MLTSIQRRPFCFVLLVTVWTGISSDAERLFHQRDHSDLKSESQHRAQPITDSHTAELFLSKYGFLKPVNWEDFLFQEPEEPDFSFLDLHEFSLEEGSAASRSREDPNPTLHDPQFTGALRDFQVLSGLPVTGVLDEATKEAMNQPRCGVPDIEAEFTEEHLENLEMGDLDKTLENTENNFVPKPNDNLDTKFERFPSYDLEDDLESFNNSYNYSEIPNDENNFDLAPNYSQILVNSSVEFRNKAADLDFVDQNLHQNLVQNLDQNLDNVAQESSEIPNIENLDSEQSGDENIPSNFSENSWNDINNLSKDDTNTKIADHLYPFLNQSNVLDNRNVKKSIESSSFEYLDNNFESSGSDTEHSGDDSVESFESRMYSEEDLQHLSSSISHQPKASGTSSAVFGNKTSNLDILENVNLENKTSEIATHVESDPENFDSEQSGDGRFNIMSHDSENSWNDANNISEVKRSSKIANNFDPFPNQSKTSGKSSDKFGNTTSDVEYLELNVTSESVTGGSNIENVFFEHSGDGHLSGNDPHYSDSQNYINTNSSSHEPDSNNDNSFQQSSKVIDNSPVVFSNETLPMDILDQHFDDMPHSETETHQQSFTESWDKRSHTAGSPLYLLHTNYTNTLDMTRSLNSFVQVSDHSAVLDNSTVLSGDKTFDILNKKLLNSSSQSSEIETHVDNVFLEQSGDETFDSAPRYFNDVNTETQPTFVESFDAVPSFTVLDSSDQNDDIENLDLSFETAESQYLQDDVHYIHTTNNRPKEEIRPKLTSNFDPVSNHTIDTSSNTTTKSDPVSNSSMEIMHQKIFNDLLNKTVLKSTTKRTISDERFMDIMNQTNSAENDFSQNLQLLSLDEFNNDTTKETQNERNYTVEMTRNATLTLNFDQIDEDAMDDNSKMFQKVEVTQRKRHLSTLLSNRNRRRRDVDGSLEFHVGKLLLLSLDEVTENSRTNHNYTNYELISNDTSGDMQNMDYRAGGMGSATDNSFKNVSNETNLNSTNSFDTGYDQTTKEKVPKKNAAVKKATNSTSHNSFDPIDEDATDDNSKTSQKDNVYQRKLHLSTRLDGKEDQKNQHFSDKNHSTGETTLKSSSTSKFDPSDKGHNPGMSKNYKLTQRKRHLLTLLSSRNHRRRNVKGLRGRVRRDADGFAAFSKSVLRWRLMGEGYSSQLSVEEQRYVFRLAFRMWSEVCPLDFIEDTTSPLEEVDIRLGFGTGRHLGCKQRFDGSGREFAHAWFLGDIHFDDDEHFTGPNAGKGISLLKVAVHEIGHVLGLPHIHRAGSIMQPSYLPQESRFEMDWTDRRAIQSLYGGCRGRFSTVFDWIRTERTPSGEVVVRFNTYFMREGWYWLYENRNNRTRYGDPVSVQSGWRGLPFSGVDAFVHVWSRRKDHVYFFKGSQFWRYDSDQDQVFRRDPDGQTYPRPITEGFPGVPAPIDTAVFDRRDGNIYFFKGALVFAFSVDSQSVARGFPRPLRSVFPSLDPQDHPHSDLDAAYFSYSHNALFLFKDTAFWRAASSRDQRRRPQQQRNTLMPRRQIHEQWYDICNVHPTALQLRP